MNIAKSNTKMLNKIGISNIILFYVNYSWVYKQTFV